MYAADLPLGQEPIPGHKYLVDCINLAKLPHWPPSLRNFRDWYTGHFISPVPVIGPPHTDPDLKGTGGEWPHIHVDIRFIDVEELRRYWGLTPADVNPDGDPHHIPVLPTFGALKVNLLTGEKTLDPYWAEFRLPTPEPMLLECRRRIGDFRKMCLGNHIGFHRIQDQVEGKSINPTRPFCPHRGIPLAGQPVRDGTVTCPGHGLNFCALTGKFIRKCEHSDDKDSPD